MIEITQKVSEISKYLQTLTSEKYSPQIESAANKQDKTALIKICKQAKIPAFYIPSVVSVIMSVSPQKWPDMS